MVKIIKKTLVFLPILSSCILTSCIFDIYREYVVISEKMFFDSSTNLRYQNVIREERGDFTWKLYNTHDVKLIDGYQLPNTFTFDTGQMIDINIPYSSLDFFFFESPYRAENPKSFCPRTDIENVTNSRDARVTEYDFFKDKMDFYEHYKCSFFIRFSKNNGDITLLNHELTLNFIISRNLLMSDDYSVPPRMALNVYFWDMLCDIEDFDYASFDGERYQAEMYEKMKPIQDNDLIKGQAYWDDGTRIDNSNIYIRYYDYYYGPPDPTYEIVV